MRMWTIEHPTRGVLTSIDLIGRNDYKPHFQWSKPAYEGQQYSTVEYALKAKKTIPLNIQVKCKIIEWEYAKGQWRRVNTFRGG